MPPSMNETVSEVGTPSTKRQSAVSRGSGRYQPSVVLLVSVHQPHAAALTKTALYKISVNLIVCPPNVIRSGSVEADAANGCRTAVINPIA